MASRCRPISHLFRRESVLTLSAVLLFALPVPIRAQEQVVRSKRIVFVGAQVADGTGAPLRRANVRIRGATITRVGNFKPGKQDEVVDAAGLVLSPGFIDTHNHSTEGLLTEPLAVSQISQGLTTLLLGQDGESPWPIGEYLDKFRKDPPALNFLMLVGHATVREKVMGEDYKRVARPDEIEQMDKLVEQGMKEGAVGLSSGLEYVVGSYSSREEVVSMAAVAGRYGGFYISHIRDEADKAFDAMRELVTIGREGHVPVQNTHIKLGTVGVWGKAADVIKMYDDARAQGVDVTADCYPYDAWHSDFKVLVPNKQWGDPASVSKAIADVGGPQNLLITEHKPHPEYADRTVEEVAKSRGITPTQLVIEIIRDGDGGVIGKSMIEPDIRIFYVWPWTMVSSDGGIGMHHPRGAGTFPKVLGRFVREKHWLTLEEAVRKMTSLPAWRLKLRDRGTIKEGMKADIVLFNPATVIDNSTYEKPQLLSTGIEKVFVNGVEVWDGTKPTGARPGRVLPK
jgi:N-acyl-D-amino-acid deacylase